MIRHVKILRGVLPHIIDKRQITGKKKRYTTNREILAFGLYSALKSLTTSSKISHYHNQLNKLARYCKVSPNTFKTYLKYAQEFGYLRYDSKTEIIQLVSYQTICNKFKINKEFHQIKYNTNDKQKTWRYILTALEIKEQKQKQFHMIWQKLCKNPPLKTALLKQPGVTKRNIRRTLLNYQEQLYKQGSKNEQLYQYRNILFSINADTERTRQNIKHTYGYKSEHSVYYLKKQMVKRGIATVEKRIYIGNHAAWNKNQYTTRHRETGERITIMPDKITLNHSVIC